MYMSFGNPALIGIVFFSVNDGQLKSRPYYHGITNAIRTIYREEGYRGMYRGVTANCLGAGASWGFYFYFYNSIKDWMLDGNNQVTLGPWYHMIAAAQAGMITLVSIQFERVSEYTFNSGA